MWCKQLITTSIVAVGLLMPGLSSAAVSASNFAATPPNITDTSDPFVMISLSVELTQQAEAYTDGEQTYVGGTYCPGRLGSGGNAVGICYTGSEVYLGYFDPNKCYEYYGEGVSTGDVQKADGPQDDLNQHHFRPVGKTNSAHECGDSKFSGNFMNWATMTALDEFRYAMTGGARLVDTAGENAKTLLTRTHRYGDWKFVKKKISSATSGDDWLSVGTTQFVNDVSKLTPFGNTIITVDNGNSKSQPYGNQVRFYDKDGNLLGRYNVIVEVCNSTVGLEDNCVEYTDGTHTWYKPEGVMQKHALEMRYALTSYTAQDGNERNGGVLRANAKYIGYKRPAANGGLEVNPDREIDAQGRYINNPDHIEDEAGVINSGILNYINAFGLGSGKYKSNDPVAELYYEGLRYIKNLNPTPEYYRAASENGMSLNDLTPSEKDNFPVVTVWDDPILDACQSNYMIAIGDQFSWGDNSLPGSTITGSGIPSMPSNPDNDINVTELTNTVGRLENYYPPPVEGEEVDQGYKSLGSRQRIPDTDPIDPSKTRDRNGWYLAGLAYYANTSDIRSDFPGKQTVKTFVVDTQEYNSNPPTHQANPLWLAAKYGGFDDLNGDGDPNNDSPQTSTAEWDADNNGEPDTYTLASQPANLIKGLNAAFNVISERISAGSAASVVTNSFTGSGAVYQGLYKPMLTKGSDRAEWLGIVHALFIDDHGNFREDTKAEGDDGKLTAGDSKLTDTDKIIRFRYSEADGKTLVDRYTTIDGGKTATLEESGVEIEDLHTIWNARDRLAELVDVTTQRNYTSSAEGGRYIFTAIDSDGDGIVESSDDLDFVADSFPAASEEGSNNNFRYLGLNATNGDNAPNIVNFIRGQEGIAGYRSRTIDYNNDDAREVWRLGDIIHSSPVTVSRPTERYDLTYGDETYAEFRNKYLNRRHVVYVGANDGMLHAFNAGFYSNSNKEFSPGGHPLGSELWAYVPYNLLPHLRWLTETDYPHVYYVDGIPQVFDANIFEDDCSDEGGTQGACIHPNGWGTILVVGLRFGGGDVTFDPDSETDAELEDDITTRSSYIILDITDPEREPELVAEISHPEMGYATTRPALFKNRQPNAESGSFKVDPAANDWYLVIGSGPAGSSAAAKQEALRQGVSDQNAKVFVFDLINKNFEVSGTDTSFDVTGASNGFVGDLTSVDWNKDYVDDAVYFGTVQGTVNAPTGALMRLRPGASFDLTPPSFSKLIDTEGQPFSAKPHVTTDASGDNHWIHVGSGRFYVPDDNLSHAQQSYYGIKEPVDGTGALTYDTVDVDDDLIDTSGIEVFTDGTIRDSDGNSTITLSNNAEVNSFASLKRAISTESGWYFDFDDPRARNVGRSGQFGVSILFTEYIPGGEVCDPLGQTFLNAVHFETGTAAPFAALNRDGTITQNKGDLSERSVNYGVGLVRDVYVSAGGDGKARAIGQDSTGGLTSKEINGPPVPKGRMSWREIDIDW